MKSIALLRAVWDIHGEYVVSTHDGKQWLRIDGWGDYDDRKVLTYTMEEIRWASIIGDRSPANLFGHRLL